MPVDLDLYFIDYAFAVTDLDKNGIAEVCIMCKNSCMVTLVLFRQNYYV